MHRRGRLRYVDLPSLFGLIEHPTEGLVLYDTGWSPWLERLPPWLPRAAYRAFVPFRVDDRSSAAGQLRALGHDPAAVRHVIASHFHADHVGGLPDFPNATVHASAAAWYHLKRSCRFTLWRQGYFPSLISEDQRVSLVGDLRGGGWGPFARTHDLFGDGTLRLLELGGHAPGQLGLLLSLEGGQVLFAADAAWVTGNIRDQVGPSRVAQPRDLPQSLHVRRDPGSAP